MEKILEIVAWIGAHYQEILGAVVTVISGVIGIALLIPGDQPEKALKGIVDFISKFSRKPESK